jgi:hypothetical protein
MHRFAGCTLILINAVRRPDPFASCLGDASRDRLPDLNPIEQAFSKLKAHLRKAGERTIPRLSRRIGALTAKFSPQECANYFRHAGYAST